MTNPNNTSQYHTSLPNLVTINVPAQAPLKLTSSNYLSWKLQFQTLFIGYDLQGFVDGTKPCPPQSIITDTSNTLNPAYHTWIRQDQLILNALIGAIHHSIIPFIACATTSQQAWKILASTYATPSRGRIKQVKSTFKALTNGSLSISDFIHSVKARADELAMLGAPIDGEDITDKILEELEMNTKNLYALYKLETPPFPLMNFMKNYSCLKLLSTHHHKSLYSSLLQPMQHLLVLDIGHRTILIDTLLLPHSHGTPHLIVLQDYQANYTIKDFIPHDLVLVPTWDTARSMAFKGTQQKNAPRSSLSLTSPFFPKAATIPHLGNHRLILQPALNPAILQTL